MSELAISKSSKIACVIGATGLVGRHLVDALVEHSFYDRVVVVSRTPPAKESSLEWVAFPTRNMMTVEALSAVLPKGQDFFSCLGTTRAKAGSLEAFEEVDLHYNSAFAKTALHLGYSQYLLVSSGGANANSTFPYLRVKGELERLVKTLPFWSTHIFRPGVLLGERNENRFGEDVAKRIFRALDWLTGKRLAKVSPIEAEVVALAMITAAQRTQGGVYTYQGTELLNIADAYYDSQA